MSYPVHYRVEHPDRFTRPQLATRLVAFLILGLLGLSFWTLLFVGYLALPVYAAMRATGDHRYGEAERPKLLRTFRWVAAVCAWAGLISDRIPDSPEETVKLSIEPGAAARPTTASAIWRVLRGIPSAIVLALAGVVGSFVWLWAAVSILLFERVGDGAFEYLVGLQRWSVRLLAYQASLVDEYPPFAFRESATQVAGETA